MTRAVAVLRLMRAQAIAAANHDADSADITAVAAKLREALAALGDIEQITKRANNIRTQAAAIDTTATSIRSRLESDINQAVRLLNPTE